jgi:hypothetical protein
MTISKKINEKKINWNNLLNKTTGITLKNLGGVAIYSNTVDSYIQFGAGMAGSDNVKGIQVGGLVGSDNVKGIQVGVGIAYTDDIKGIQVGGLVGAENVKGIQVGGLVAADNVKGIQVGCGLAIVDNVIGYQNSNFNKSNKLKGLQTTIGIISPTILKTIDYMFDLNLSTEAYLMAFGTGVNYSNNVNGSQITLGVNICNDELKGSQIGSLNLTDKLKGNQTGFINYANEGKGLQVGLLNIKSDAPWYAKVIPGIAYRK